METLYLDELRKGAGLVDIGIWKTLFDRAVVATVFELADNGYIGLLQGGEPSPDDARMGSTRASPRNRVVTVIGGGSRIPISFAVEILRFLRRLVPAEMCAAINLWRHAAESSRR